MRRWGLTLAILVLGGVVAFGQQLPAEPEVETEQTEVLVQTIENDPIPLRDWEVPSLPDLTAGHHRLRAGTEALPSDPSPMIAMIPCRIVDTRWAAGAWGGPYLHAGVARLFDLNSAPHCPGIPSNVSAYSVNVTVTNPAAAGWITIWPGGAAEVTISTLNYLAGQTVANAAITPAGTGGSITVKSVADTHLIIDINGYFRDGTVLSQIP